MNIDGIAWSLCWVVEQLPMFVFQAAHASREMGTLFRTRDLLRSQQSSSWLGRVPVLSWPMKRNLQLIHVHHAGGAYWTQLPQGLQELWTLWLQKHLHCVAANCPQETPPTDYQCPMHVHAVLNALIRTWAKPSLHPLLTSHDFRCTAIHSHPGIQTIICKDLEARLLPRQILDTVAKSLLRMKHALHPCHETQPPAWAGWRQIYSKSAIPMHQHSCDRLAVALQAGFTYTPFLAFLAELNKVVQKIWYNPRIGSQDPLTRSQELLLWEPDGEPENHCWEPWL